MADEQQHDDPDGDEAMDSVLDASKHLTDCIGLGTADAAHCLMGGALFIAQEEMSTADFAEWLSEVRQVLDEREADLRGRAS
ncbi:hypothetical protein AAFN88_08735 [Pelagibius sp. CAU 1746]|uniref:hypothetical protein n=1 Tax=Pelagibius sp. CAU 1746 TaxID=3140370 RepID=UPI00325BD183